MTNNSRKNNSLTSLQRELVSISIGRVILFEISEFVNTFLGIISKKPVKNHVFQNLTQYTW